MKQISSGSLPINSETFSTDRSQELNVTGLSFLHAFGHLYKGLLSFVAALCVGCLSFCPECEVSRISCLLFEVVSIDTVLYHVCEFGTNLGWCLKMICFVTYIIDSLILDVGYVLLARGILGNKFEWFMFVSRGIIFRLWSWANNFSVCFWKFFLNLVLLSCSSLLNCLGMSLKELMPWIFVMHCPQALCHLFVLCYKASCLLGVWVMCPGNLVWVSNLDKVRMHSSEWNYAVCQGCIACICCFSTWSLLGLLPFIISLIVFRMG